MFCDKAKKQCHQLNCPHAGRHEKQDACFSHICVEFGLEVNCIKSTISDELVEFNSKNDFDSLKLPEGD